MAYHSCMLRDDILLLHQAWASMVQMILMTPNPEPKVPVKEEFTVLSIMPPEAARVCLKSQALIRTLVRAEGLCCGTQAKTQWPPASVAVCTLAVMLEPSWLSHVCPTCMYQSSATLSMRTRW